MSASRKVNPTSSSEDDDQTRYATIIDEKKRKRMISNRESARRSRMKREQHIKDLNDQITYYRTRSSEMVHKINEIERRFMAVDSENRILTMHGEELKKRLELLVEMMASYNNDKNDNSFWNYVVENDDDCFVMEVLEDPLVKPWMQPSFQTRTVDAIYQF